MKKMSLKNIFRILLSLILVLMMTFSFCACDAISSLTGESSKKESSKKDKDDKDEEEEEEEEEEEDSEKDETKEDKEDKETEEDKPTSAGVLTGLSVNKINSVTKDSLYSYKGGLQYRDYDTKKYGVMTFDGKKDTGAIYAYCENTGALFTVTKELHTNADDIANMNSAILINGEGKELVTGYAAYQYISNRYVQAYTVTQQTPYKAEALIYFSSYEYNNDSIKDNVYYKGVWDVIDLTTGQRVPGVSGTNTYGVSASGEFITYYDDAKVTHIVDAKGNAADKSSYSFFSDGSYIKYSGSDAGTLYSADGKELFSFGEKDFKPISFESGYYVARKYGEKFEYAVMDKTGKIVSATFEEYLSVKGELIWADEKVYDFKGNRITELKAEGFRYDGDFGKAYAINDDDDYTFITVDGTVLYTGESDDDFYVNASNYSAYQKVESDYMYWSYKDKGYTLKGRDVGPWMVAAEDGDYVYDLVDTITGKKLLSGYSSYTYISLDDGTKYVYAKTDKGVTEIYEVK